MTCHTDEEGHFEFAGVRLGVAHVVETSPFWAGESRYSPARPITGIVLSAENRRVERELSLRVATDVVVLVRDDAGAPVPKAAITATPQSGRSEGTDESGRGRIYLVEPGRIQIHASADGFRSADTEVSVQEGCTVTVELQLVRGAEISGRIVDDRGAPLRAAEVRLWAAETCEQLLASDADGRFVLRTIRDGAVAVTATSRGHLDVRAEIPTAPCTGLRLVATRCAEITATAPPARAGWYRYDFDFQWVAQSGEVTRGSCFPEESEGWRIQAFISPGNGRLRLFLPDAVPLEVPLVVEPGSARDLGSLRPDPGETADLLVTDAHGVPVGAASVEVTQGGEVRGRDDTSANGHCRIRGLSRGAAWVRVEARTFAIRALQIDVGGTSEAHHVTIEPGAPLVVQLEGEPSQHVVLTLRPDEGTPAALLASEETYVGQSVQWWVAPGRYVIRCGDVEKSVEVSASARATPVRIDVSSESR